MAGSIISSHQGSAIGTEATMKKLLGTLLFIGVLYGIWLGLNETGGLPAGFGFLGDEGQLGGER